MPSKLRTPGNEFTRAFLTRLIATAIAVATDSSGSHLRRAGVSPKSRIALARDGARTVAGGLVRARGRRRQRRCDSSEEWRPAHVRDQAARSERAVDQHRSAREGVGALG